MAQFVEPLKKHGIELEISPFLDAKQFGEFYKGSGILTKASGTLGPVLKRIGQLGTVGKYDLIFVQREAMFFGPALFEWLYKSTSGAPVVLDLDDATYIRYVSPRYGKTGAGTSGLRRRLASARSSPRHLHTVRAPNRMAR